MISFSTIEADRLIKPHHNALVISLCVANYLIKRILIDNGSFMNVLFLNVFREMGLKDSELIR